MQMVDSCAMSTAVQGRNGSRTFSGNHKLILKIHFEPSNSLNQSSHTTTNLTTTYTTISILFITTFTTTTPTTYSQSTLMNDLDFINSNNILIHSGNWFKSNIFWQCNNFVLRLLLLQAGWRDYTQCDDINIQADRRPSVWIY